MKIGILTYHKAHNYGALLQAIATRVVLEKMGNEVYYVDYEPQYHKVRYLPFSFRELYYRRIKLGWRYIKNYVCFFREIHLRYQNFHSFIKNNIEPYCKSAAESFDLVVYGSDQIWRKQRRKIGYNPMYFADQRVRSKRKISYAASIGILPNTEEDILQVKKMCSNFDNISVREKDLKDFLMNNGFKNVRLDVDPTLLLPKEFWKYYVTPSVDTNYILLYHLQQSAFDIRKVEEFAKQQNLSLKIIYGDVVTKQTDVDDVVAGPAEFLSLVYNAACVLTSSFHGLVFSILFEKPFYASFAYKKERAISTLEQLGLEKFLIDGNKTIDKIPLGIDYKSVKQRLEQLKQSSLDYLKEQTKTGQS